MKKKLLIYFAFVIGLLLWGGSVYALPISGMRMYYIDGEGVMQYRDNVSYNQWAGYDVAYIDYGYDQSNFGPVPQTLYTFFGSYNCTENCQVTGTLINALTGGGTLTQAPIPNVQIEANGIYNNCIANASVFSNYEKIDFVCNAGSLNNGFNIVSNGSGFLLYPDRDTYYGIAYNSITIQELLGTSGIITNNNQNTQNIINNNNQNTQSIINNQNQNVGAVINNDNQNTQAIINSITDSTPQTENESSSTLDRWKNLIPTNGVVSSLFLIPVNLIDKLVVGFNGTCQTFNLGNLLGTDLVLPCIQPANFFGSTLWGIIDLACCGMMLFSMFKKFVKVFSDITNLRDTPMNELYGGGR